MEANLLRYLMSHEGKAVSRKAMLEDVWGLHEDTDTRAIDHFIVQAAAIDREGAGPSETPADRSRRRLQVRGESLDPDPSPDR